VAPPSRRRHAELALERTGLMMGEVAATFLSRLAVPVVYYLIARRGWAGERVTRQIDEAA
jgi:hypothetical protein